jgi:hypothetical protein
MGFFPVERQLILNRLGKTSLNSDTVELIKSFAFESWQNWCIRVEAERMKRLTNKCVKRMEIWRTLDNQQWVCGFDAYAHKDNVSYFKEIGASNCEHCGNYFAHMISPMEFRPSHSLTICAPRAICDCVDHWYDDNLIEEEDWDF